MAVEYVYITAQGDTWDIIARDVYGSEKMAYLIQQKNPAYLNLLYFPAGLEIILPETPPEATSTPDAPWKRGQFLAELPNAIGKVIINAGLWNVQSEETSGVTSHDDLTDRDLPGQHPMKATTGLLTALERKAEASALGPLATTPDAPADGKTYGRKDGGWAETTGGSAEFPEGGEAGDVLVSDGDGGAEWEDREEFAASLPKASTDTLGLCRVDGATIEADADGVLSVVNAVSADPFFSVSPSGGLLLNAFAEATESEFFVLSGNGIYLKGAV